ncbi:MAG: hypothetical protein ABI338_00310 [Gemmatimonadaceae bacterium]
MNTIDRASELRKLAHDVRNALNGVSVNLEVARSRTSRGADATQVSPFLESAAQQLEAAASLHKRYTDVAMAFTTAADSGRSSQERSDTIHTPDPTPTHGS